MLPIQKAAIDRNMEELVNAAELVTPLLLTYLWTSEVLSNGELEMIEGKPISAAKLYQLFGILKTKDAGWSHLLLYLRANGQSNLAVKLEKDADEETSANGSKGPKRSVLEEFSIRLAHYYQRYYANVPTMGQSGKHVKDVWVPLQIDGRREAHLKADRIDHIELLSRLKLTDGSDVALIKGDPGMGKTTLAKKIAYGWAVDYISNCLPQFSLILAVPLRSAGKSTLFDQLAIDYFLTIGGGQLVQDINKKELKEEINKLGSQLLVILDGLDEYANYSESPFKVMFSGPFQLSAAYCKEPPPIVNFKLIITSRPYACESVQIAFPVIRFLILPLDQDHLNNFVRLYCETSHGAARVTEYLKTNAHLVIKVPLILTFICYLADSVQEIPTNMTSLYDSFIRQMLRRENRQEKLAESVDLQSWKESNVVKTTNELAYRGIIGVDYEFSKSDLKNCHVTNDSFICGFLLHKFNFAQETLKAEFPHRSIQEFFAALHCYQLMLSGCQNELSEVNNMIISDDSLVGRFFFGICSNEGRFDQMAKWLRPSLLDYNVFLSAVVINAFGATLADCSTEQNFTIGQMLFDSAGDLDDYKINFELEYLFGVESLLRLDQFSYDFKKGLHLSVLPRDNSLPTTDWFLADNRKSARLACVQYRLLELLEEKFDQIDVLILIYGSIDSSTSLDSVKVSCTQPQSDSQIISEFLIHQIQQLPPAVIFVITPQVDIPFTSTTVTVRYGSELGMKLTNFQFHYKNADRDELLGIVAMEKLADLTADETTEDKSGEKLTIRKFKVTVNEEMSQSTLILSLLRLSLLSTEQRKKTWPKKQELVDLELD